MTTSAAGDERGYALAAGEALQHLDMGGGSVLSLQVTGAQSRGLVTVLHGALLRGGPPLHVHDHEDEVVAVLEGRLDYRVGDETGALEPGGTLWLPRGVPHAVANLAGGTCRFLTVVTPSGIEDFFRAQHEYGSSLRPGEVPDPARMGSVAGADVRRAVGPPLG